jgi:hypothetical protein
MLDLQTRAMHDEAAPRRLSQAERGALALADAASALDGAADTATFLRALDHNRRVWHAVLALAHRHHWPVPDQRQTAFALDTTARASVSDHDIHSLVAINRRVSSALAGGCIDTIRRRAYDIWEEQGRPRGQALDHWLLAEMEPARAG